MTVVEAVIGVDLGANWIQPLLRQNASSGPMKWPQVAAFIANGTGEEARAARTGLGAQQIIVTDPVREMRQLDVYLHERGAAPVSPALFAKPARGAGPIPPGSPTERVRQYVFRTTLEQSGLGRLCNWLADADNHPWDGDIALRGVSADAYLAPITDSLEGSVNKAMKLASKTTALASALLDPDRRPGRRFASGEDAVFTPRICRTSRRKRR